MKYLFLQYIVVWVLISFIFGTECGGKLTDPNGEISVEPTSLPVPNRYNQNWRATCEWTVEVKPGRTIEIKVNEMPAGTDANCIENYVMVSPLIEIFYIGYVNDSDCFIDYSPQLKNGDATTSSLLGSGKYCPNDTIPTLQTTGNRLYVKVTAVRPKLRFKLTYK